MELAQERRAKSDRDQGVVDDQCGGNSRMDMVVERAIWNCRGANRFRQEGRQMEFGTFGEGAFQFSNHIFQFLDFRPYFGFFVQFFRKIHLYLISVLFGNFSTCRLIFRHFSLWTKLPNFQLRREPHAEHVRIRRNIAMDHQRTPQSGEDSLRLRRICVDKTTLHNRWLKIKKLSDVRITRSATRFTLIPNHFVNIDPLCILIYISCCSDQFWPTFQVCSDSQPVSASNFSVLIDPVLLTDLITSDLWPISGHFSSLNHFC